MRLVKSMSRVLAVLGTLVLAFAGFAGIGNAQATSSGDVGAQAVYHFVRNIGSENGCMDLTSFNEDTPATLYRCYSASGYWYFADDRTIRNGPGSGQSLCLDPDSYATHAQVRLKRCYDAARQKWHHSETNNTIVSEGSGSNMCLDLRSYANQTPVTLYPCHGGASQQWSYD
ncbi:RICIN domain-containing protein [Actinomadura rubrisoli]|nr:RICIN domain-containing protein [Actinomadura rubrisoli]